VRLRPLDESDLDEVARVHCAAFRKSAMTALGRDIVRCYYLWQFRGPGHQTYATGAWIDSRLAGFCVGGYQPTSLSGFLAQNRTRLVLRVLTRPWLLGNPLFRDRLTQGLRVLRRAFSRSAPAPAAPQRAASTEAPRKPPFDILSIAVDPAVQGMGVGKALMLHAQEQAREYGFYVMTLYVNGDNDQAIRFYEHLGWERCIQNGAWRGRMENWLERPAVSTA